MRIADFRKNTVEYGFINFSSRVMTKVARKMIIK
jgi:hypothetical protein